MLICTEWWEAFLFFWMVCAEIKEDCYFFSNSKIFFTTLNDVYWLSLSNKHKTLYFYSRKLFSGHFGVVISPSPALREMEIGLLEAVTWTSALIMLFCQGQAGGGFGK